MLVTQVLYPTDVGGFDVGDTIIYNMNRDVVSIESIVFYLIEMAAIDVGDAIIYNMNQKSFCRADRCAMQKW